MKIYLPQPNKRLIGGPYSFLKNLRHVFISNNYGIQVANNHLQAEGILFPVSYSKAWIRYYKRLGLPIIQRLDGLHYPQKHGDSYQEKNKLVEPIYKHIASHIIFQSHHSEAQFKELLGASSAQRLGLILNGARQEIFYPNKEHTLNKRHIKFITTGNFRGEDMLQPILKALDLLHGQLEFTFSIMGKLNYSNKFIEEIHSKPYVKLLPSGSLEEIATALREHDAYIFSHLNPPCPNSVIEALSCGLPVVSFDSGAMEELCSQKELLAPTKNKTTFNTIEDLDPKTLADAITYTAKNYKVLREQALKNSQNYSMEVCAQRYAEAINKIQISNTPSILKRLPFFLLAHIENGFELLSKIPKRFCSKS